MNAKETLTKIAEALGVISEKTIEETPVVNAEETNVEALVVETEVAEGEVAEETPVVESEEVVEEPAEVVEEKVEEPAVEESKDPKDERIEQMEAQLNTLKELLKNVIEKEEAAPELPKEEPKGLTHSPEKQVKPVGTKIGEKGETIQSRVWKYINNN